MIEYLSNRIIKIMYDCTTRITPKKSKIIVWWINKINYLTLFYIKYIMFWLLKFNYSYLGNIKFCIQTNNLLKISIIKTRVVHSGQLAVLIRFGVKFLVIPILVGIITYLGHIKWGIRYRTVCSINFVNIESFRKNIYTSFDIM